MTDMIPALLAIISVASAALSLVRRGGFAQFPFLISVVYLGWVLPQVASLQNDPFLPTGAMDRVCVMAILVLLAIWAGWTVKSDTPTQTFGPYESAETRLKMPTVVLTTVGVAIQITISALAASIEGQWTGPITILATLSAASSVALSISYLTYLQSREKFYLLMTIVNIISFAPTIILNARRGGAVTLIAVMVFGLWFVRKYYPPKVLVLGAVLLGVVAVNNIGVLRYGLATSGDFFDTLSQIQDFKSADYHEILNAASLMSITAETGFYNYGASIWNAFVSAFVPGQFIGIEAKRSLMLGESISEFALNQILYVGAEGATNSGFQDSFEMFWYFGCLIFFIISAWLRSHYVSALSGNIWSAVIYTCCISSGLHSITHYSTHLLTWAPVVLLFVAGMKVASRTYAYQVKRVRF